MKTYNIKYIQCGGAETLRNTDVAISAFLKGKPKRKAFFRKVKEIIIAINEWKTSASPIENKKFDSFKNLDDKSYSDLLNLIPEDIKKAVKTARIPDTWPKGQVEIKKCTDFLTGALYINKQYLDYKSALANAPVNSPINYPINAPAPKISDSDAILLNILKNEFNNIMSQCAMFHTSGLMTPKLFDFFTSNGYNVSPNNHQMIKSRESVDFSDIDMEILVGVAGFKPVSGTNPIMYSRFLNVIH